MTNQFWQNMRREGFMVADCPARKIAVFPNQSGQVVVAVRQDGLDCIATLDAEELDAFMAKFKDASEIAVELDAVITASYAISVAKGGA